MSRSERTRRRILDATLRLFRESGSGSVRVQDVADAAGVTRQAVYFHFGNRSGLLTALVRYVDEEVEDLGARAAPVWEAPDGTEAVDRFVELVADYYPRIADIARELYGARATDADADAAWRDRLESRKRACRRLVRWLERDGALAANLGTEDAVDLLTMLTSFETWEDLTLYQGWDRARYVRGLRRMLRRTLLRGEARG